MGSAAEILVSLLIVILGLFTVLGVILAVLLVRITHQIKRTGDSAKRAAETIENTVLGVSRLSSPLLLVKALSDKVRMRKEAAQSKLSSRKK